jgi:CHAT domain-containing protein
MTSPGARAALFRLLELVLILLVPAVGCAAALVDSQPQPGEAIAEADRLYAAGDVQGAIGKYLEALALFEGLAEASYAAAYDMDLSLGERVTSGVQAGLYDGQSAAVLTWLSDCYRELRDLTNADTTMARAEEIMERHGLSLDEIPSPWWQSLEAATLLGRGDPEGAARSASRAYGFALSLIALYPQDRTYKSEAVEALWSLYLARSTLGNPDGACKCLADALPLALDIGYEDIGWIYLQLVRCDLRRGQYLLAEYDLSSAFSTFQERDNKRGLTAAYMEYAELLSIQGEIERAESYLQAAVAMVEASGDPSLESYVCETAAAFAMQSEDYGRALGLLDRLLRDCAGASCGASTLGRLHSEISECLEGLVRASESLTHLALSIDYLETSQRHLHSAGAKSSYREGLLPSYQKLALGLLVQGELDEALACAERSKARVLVDMVETALLQTATRMPAQLRGVSEALAALAAFTPVEGQEVLAVAAVEPMTSQKAEPSWAEHLASEYEQATEELQERCPQLGETVSLDPTTLLSRSSEVTEHLGADALALEYFVTDAETILWVITEDGIQTASRIVVSRENFAEAVRSFRDVVQAPPLDPTLPVLSYHKILQEAKPLYDLLIAPVEEYLAGVEHLVIIPSDVLFYVPFAALYQCPDETDLYKETVTRCAGGAGGTQPTGQFLIERFTLSYAPSLASLYWPLQHEGDGSYTSVLSVGNPTGDLEYSQTEARTVARLFPDSTLLLREEGTEARVKEELAAREYDVVHLSTHGLFNPAMPLLSEVVFREGGGEDGHLYAGEILGLSLSHTELVVMSACQTALPPEISQDVVVGDEIQGLGQALFVAGVPTALLTLWNVNDASTGELMIEFYQSLMSSGHATKAESLAAAQLALFRGDYGLAYRHPYYWAPFVMYGEWR